MRVGKVVAFERRPKTTGTTGTTHTSDDGSRTASIRPTDVLGHVVLMARSHAAPRHRRERELVAVNRFILLQRDTIHLTT